MTDDKQREIKFKFYYKKADGTFFSVIKTLGDLINNKSFGIVGNESHISEFTGLQDKNNKDIYEDDKLNLEQWTGDDEEIDEIRNVKFLEGSFIVSGISGYCNINLVNTDLCEVIGNNIEA